MWGSRCRSPPCPLPSSPLSGCPGCMSPNHMWGHGVAAVMLSGDAAESACWGYSNILGDLVAPPSDSGAVLGFLDAGKCMHRGSIRPGLLPSGWLASQTPHIAHCPPSISPLGQYMSCGTHLSSGDQDPGQQRCCNGPLQSMPMFPPSSLVLVPGRGYLLLRVGDKAI